MRGIPVLNVEGSGIAETWEKSVVELYDRGCEVETEYDKPGDPPSIDATMLLTIRDPLSEPMIHRDMPCGFEGLQEYVMEVTEGIKDHLVRDQDAIDDHRWEYTYHQRLFGYTVLQGSMVWDQIEIMCQKLAKSPHTRRAQAVTWKVWEDNDCYDPACLQSLWCRILPVNGVPTLSMNVRFRSNDAYKAAFMNIFALVAMQKLIARKVSKITGEEVRVGRYCHIADSYHIYGSNLGEFRDRFLKAYNGRPFKQRVFRYEDVRDIMLEARPSILAKAAKMGRD